MKIVEISQHGCVRVMKQALPLLARGHDVHLVVNKVTQFSEQLKTVTTFQDQDQLYEAVKLHGDADVFHVHNEPCWGVTVCKEIFPKKAVVLDLHDSFLLRRKVEEIDGERYAVSVDERNNVQLADGIVYVCDPMKSIVENTFKPDCPSIVLPSYVPERFYRIDFGRWWGGLVYEGRIDLPDELAPKWDFFQYANYLELAKQAKAIGMDFHVYTPRKKEEVRQAYESVAYLHDPVGMAKLCKKLGSHDWGLVGNIKPFPEWEHALPNKLFEYMAGCVPIVAIYADECTRFIEEYGVGISVNSLEELAGSWAKHRECRKNVVKYRSEFIMERHIHRLENLYKKVMR